MTPDGPMSVTLICGAIGTILALLAWWQEVRWKREADAWREKHHTPPAE